MNKSNTAKKIVVALLVSFLFLGSNANAYSLDQPKDIPILKDYVVGPGRTEIRLDAGQTSIKSITVLNRFGKEMRFNIEIEDFTSPDDMSGSVKLLGNERGPYSLKDYLKPDTNSFILQQGDRATIPVTISIPNDATPGGLYGSVIVTYEPTDPLDIANENDIASGIKVKSRVASLFFVRVNGDVKEEGSLSGFKSGKYWYLNGPVNLSWLYKNTGNIYNSPYGVMEIKNLYGTVVDQFSINPYFVMPSSTRIMSKTWTRDFMLGRYKATLQLNRGYGDVIDTQTVVFWVMPWKIVVGMLLGLFIILLIIRGVNRWFKKNFQYKGGKKTETPQA